MAMDKQGDRQGKVWLLYDEVPREVVAVFWTGHQAGVLDLRRTEVDGQAT